MRSSSLFGTILVVAMFCCQTRASFSQQPLVPNKTYIVKDGDWGLALSKVSNKWPVMTFVPTGFLLFNIDSKEIAVTGESYVPATTQDGVRLYFPKVKIIDKEIFGSIKLMFHSRQQVCEKWGCNKVEGGTLTVEAGRGMTYKDDQSEYYSLLSDISGKSQPWGVVDKEELDRLIAKGVVTKLDQNYPRYLIERIDTSLPDINCLDPPNRQKDNIKKELITEESKIVLRLFNIGHVDDSSNSRTLIYRVTQEQNTAYKHYFYRLFDSWDKKSSFFVARVKYSCSAEGDRTFIPQVRLIQMQHGGDGNFENKYEFELPSGTSRVVKYKEEPGQNAIVLESMKTPKNLMNDVLGSEPYMWSVNTTEQYFDLMQILSDKFSDRTLAGYFLAEFNRSCIKKDRSQSNKCREHRYTQE
jgi:hypothetical protein